MRLLHYQILSPPATHMRAASCAEVECKAFLNGWISIVNPNDPELGARQYAYLTADDRPSKVERIDGGLAQFTYPAGVECFNRHEVPVGRPQLFFRRSRSRTYRHDRPEHWVEDFASNQEKLSRLIGG